MGRGDVGDDEHVLRSHPTCPAPARRRRRGHTGAFISLRRPAPSHRSRARQQAQRDGAFAGLSSGLVSGASRLPPRAPFPSSAAAARRPPRTVRPASPSLTAVSAHVAILGSKLFRLNRNATILCAVGELPHTASPSLVPPSLLHNLTAPFIPVTGVASGYQFTQGFLATNMAHLAAEKARLDKLAAEQDPSNGF